MKGKKQMKFGKKLYTVAELEVVRVSMADVITTSGIVNSGTDPDKDAGFGNVPGGDDSWDA